MLLSVPNIYLHLRNNDHWEIKLRLKLLFPALTRQNFQECEISVIIVPASETVKIILKSWKCIKNNNYKCLQSSYTVLGCSRDCIQPILIPVLQVRKLRHTYMWTITELKSMTSEHQATFELGNMAAKLVIITNLLNSPSIWESDYTY